MRYSSGMVKDDQITQAWSAFVRESVGKMSNKAVAERIGVSDSTVGNWIRGSHFKQPDAKLVVRFARTFGRPLPTALVAAGYGCEVEYSETVMTIRDASQMSDDELDDAVQVMLAEARRRRKLAPNPDQSPL